MYLKCSFSAIVTAVVFPIIIVSWSRSNHPSSVVCQECFVPVLNSWRRKYEYFRRSQADSLLLIFDWSRKIICVAFSDFIIHLLMETCDKGTIRSWFLNIFVIAHQKYIIFSLKFPLEYNAVCTRRKLCSPLESLLFGIYDT